MLCFAMLQASADIWSMMRSVQPMPIHWNSNLGMTRANPTKKLAMTTPMMPVVILFRLNTPLYIGLLQWPLYLLVNGTNMAPARTENGLRLKQTPMRKHDAGRRV